MLYLHILRFLTLQLIVFQKNNSENLIIYTNPTAFKTFLFSQKFNETSLLLMSSGDYGGLDFDELKNLIA